ncbi:tRNA 2-thiouridine(34) synthase MnmA [Candidatus Margulisiibacteriota bacterium]
MHKKVLVGLSGGVDSAISAYLLQKEGYDVTGVIMAIWDGDKRITEDSYHSCYGPGEEKDIEDARIVSEKLDIPFHVVDLKDEYKRSVLDYFEKEYLAGRTPNPCIKCNNYMKFGALLNGAKKLGIDFDYFATGHYARVLFNNTTRRYELLRGKDLLKDQSYFIYTLRQDQLKQTILPLGTYLKKDVRVLAEKLGFENADRDESQNFIAGDYAVLLKGTEKKGDIVDDTGRVLGIHDGIQFFTVGQRRGLGISSREPLYVTKIDAQNNAVVVGTKPKLLGEQLMAENCNWISIETLEKSIELTAKIRYQSKDAACEVRPLDKGNVEVQFVEPQNAITPGQSVVFYDGEIVIGGGIIS